MMSHFVLFVATIIYKHKRRMFMKKVKTILTSSLSILLVVTLLICVNVTYASMNSTTYNTVTITTPAGIAYYAKYLTSVDDAVEEYNVNDYTNAIYVGYLTKKFNCHTFAWIFGGNLNNISTNPYWVDDPRALYESTNIGSCYTKQQTSVDYYSINMNNIQVGDIVVFEYLAFNNNQTQNEANPIAHSAVISCLGTGSNSNEIRIISKWASSSIYISDLKNNPFYQLDDNTRFSIYRHNGNHSCSYLLSNNNFTHTYCCYYCGLDETTNPHTINSYSHNSTEHWGTCVICQYVSYDSHSASSYTHTAITHSGVCTACGTSFTEAHDFVYRINRYVCTVCGYSTKNPIYPNDSGEGEAE